MSTPDSLEAFAKAKNLRFRSSGPLPEQGSLLSHHGKVEGLVDGTLPGGVQGSLAYYTYTWTSTDNDGHTLTHTEHHTLVVTSVPESIGFMPSLGFAGSGSSLSGVGGNLEEVVQVDLGGDAGLKGSRCYRYKGASEDWTRQLFSPAFVDWLARSESDFGFELSDGVLTTARNGHLVDEAALTGLCEEAAHVTATIGGEADEESDTGNASGDAAKDPNAADPRMEEALASVTVAAPTSIDDAESAFRRHVARSPRTLWRALRYGLLITLLLNIPAAAVPILLAVAGAWAILAAFELLLIAIVAFFVFRKDVRESGRKYAAEAFYRAYAAGHGMKLEEPLHFAATHAEAKLSFRPDRVMTGPLPGGGEGSFCVFGDGSKRADRVAVVAGPAGPISESEFEAEPRGLTAKDLDTYLDQLAGELNSASPGKAGLPADSGPR